MSSSEPPPPIYFVDDANGWAPPGIMALYKAAVDVGRHDNFVFMSDLKRVWLRLRFWIRRAQKSSARRWHNTVDRIVSALAMDVRRLAYVKP